jgi:glycosyltransferase involved in cell wall biosynthesis
MRKREVERQLLARAGSTRKSALNLDTRRAFDGPSKGHRVVLDIQACQTEYSGTRGIGRYSRSFAEALVASRDGFDFVVCLNELFVDSANALAHEFESLVGADRVVRYAATSPHAPWSATVPDAGRMAGEWIAQYAWTAQKPDLIHISSIFEGLHGQAVVPGVLGLPRTTVVSATAYDLIPLLFADPYLDDERTRKWYQGRIDCLKKCDVLLAISEATRRDVIEHLNFPADRVVAIHGAADARFHPGDVSPERKRQLLGSLDLSKPFIMYTGGIDHRKNVEAIIRAFGLLPPPLRETHQLAIVCSVIESDRVRLQQLTKSCRLPARSVVLTGFVADDDLVDLYRCCDLFVFPSKYEGFGLPVLEAMSCGAPTIAANASSLPEIVGWNDALFSIDTDEHIAEALAHALADGDFRQTLRSHSIERAKLFSWQLTAERAQGAWSEAIARKTERIVVDVPAFKPRLAIVSPLLPERSGIADFVTELLPPLTQHFDIDLFASEKADADRYRAMGFAVQPWQSLPGMWLNYDAGVLYQFGNSEYHFHMLALLQSCPGAVLMHDAFLSGLMAYAEFGQPRIDGFFRDMLAYSHTDDALRQFAADGLGDAIERYPMCRWVADHATGVIVTSEHARQLLVAAGQVDGARCQVVPHQRSVQAISADERRRARRELSIPESTLLVCSFGIAAERKLSIELADAWSRVGIAGAGRLVFVGAAEGAYGDALRQSAGRSEETAKIEVTGYVSNEEFQRYLRAADIVVQLRKGSRGEASGAALYAMASGTPLLTSRHGSLAEIPDSACVHVDDPIDISQLAALLAELAANPDKRTSIGQRGQSWIREACSPRDIANALAAEITRFNDPAIVHRRMNLAARLLTYSQTIPEVSRRDWRVDVESRAARCEPARVESKPAESISRALIGVLPASSIVQMDPANQSGKLARGDTLTLLADDPRLMTMCGVKAGGVLETTGRQGMLLYGPYVEVDPGRYRLRVYGTNTANAEDRKATLEVVSKAGRRNLALCEIDATVIAPSASGLLARLDFDADEYISDLEFRINVPEETNMTVESVDLVAMSY